MGSKLFQCLASNRRRLFLTGLLLVGLFIGVRYFWAGGVGSAPAEYRTGSVGRGSIEALVGATGTINPVKTVEVGAQVTGKIISLYADYNSVVKAGDIIARIDPSLFQTKRDQAAANLANARGMWSKARTDLAQRKREQERTQRLFARELVSQNELDAANTAYEGALAQVEVSAAQIKQAQALLDNAELDLKYTVIRSPVNGIVIARNVEVGQTVTSGFTTPTLFLIALDLTQMQVDTNVSEADIGEVREGQTAVFTVDAYPNAEFRGVVIQIRNAPIIVQNVVTYDVVVGVENKDLRLKPGMTANVSITLTKKEDVLTVPNAAFRFSPKKFTDEKTKEGSAGGRTDRREPGGQQTSSGKTRDNGNWKTVWKVTGTGDPVPVRVRVGVTDGSVTEILEGEIGENDKVIIGMEGSAGGRKRDTLPPGFGSSQPRTHPRERGI